MWKKILAVAGILSLIVYITWPSATYASVQLSGTGAVYKSSCVSGDYSDISFFTFIKVTNNDRYNDIFMNGVSGGFGDGYGFLVTDNANGNILFLDVSYVAGLSSTLTITDNNWHFVGFTRRASDGVWTLYLDAASEEVGTSAPYDIGASCRTIVGGWNNEGTVTPSAAALFARTAYWDTLLTSTQISNIRTGTVPNTITTNLVMYLPYVSGDLANNDGGSAGDFSLNGTTAYSSDEPFAAPAASGASPDSDIIIW